MQICADRFVYGMVRAIAGAILDASRGKRRIDELKESLLKENRELASPLAPPQGPILERVAYPPELKIFN
jgi:tRNA pseudouridine38-40 synthase